MKNLFRWIFPIVLAGFFLSGCVKRMPPLWVSKIPMLKEPISPEEIFRLPEGDPISFAQLIDELQTAAVIFVGETHDQIEHHRLQINVLQGLLGKGKEVVVGMEMFERARQPTLDRWSQDLLTEDEFINEVQWETVWAMDYHLYKAILDEARNHHLKVLGLNIERDLVRKVAQLGIDGLSLEDREKLPEMDLTDQQHRNYIATIYKSHQGGSAKDFESFYQAQCLWDEAMAETLFSFLRSPDGKGKIVLVIAGSGHVAFDFGIPKRFYRRTLLPYKTIILKEWKKNIEEDLNVSKVSLPLANFLWITKPTPPEKKRPRIGVILREQGDPEGIWIERVIPGSPAEKAGLLPGDQFLAIDGRGVTKVKEIQDAIFEKGWGQDFTVTIIREGQKEEVMVTLPPLND